MAGCLKMLAPSRSHEHFPNLPAWYLLIPNLNLDLEQLCRVAATVNNAVEGCGMPSFAHGVGNFSVPGLA
jgi:hypothetical protein